MFELLMIALNLAIIVWLAPYALMFVAALGLSQGVVWHCWSGVAAGSELDGGAFMKAMLRRGVKGGGIAFLIAWPIAYVALT